MITFAFILDGSFLLALNLVELIHQLDFLLIQLEHFISLNFLLTLDLHDELLNIS
jgi:hypothetical protein